MIGGTAMTRILGAFVRIRDRRYMTGLAVVEGGAVVATRSLPAPAEAEGRQLAELHSRVFDAIGEFKPAVLSLRGSETMIGERLAKHAEGVIIAAAGLRNVPVEIKYRPTLAAKAGLGQRGKAKDATAALLSKLTGTDELAPEIQEAASAAAATAIERNEL
jgi:hypothetical protein